MSEAHKDSMTMYRSYLSSEAQGTIAAKLSQKVAENIGDNKKAVSTPSKVALFCARQEIGLRRHRQTANRKSESNNKENFIDLVVTEVS